MLHALALWVMLLVVAAPDLGQGPLLTVDIRRPEPAAKAQPPPEAPVVEPKAAPPRPRTLPAGPMAPPSFAPEPAPEPVVKPEPAPKARPAPPPDVVEISPVKKGVALPTYKATQKEYEEFAKSGGVVTIDEPALRGAKTRFGQLVGFYTYTTEEFVGQYLTADGLHSVSIVDARDTPHQALLIHDSKSGLLRRLKKFGKYVYTYGPSLNQDEPVEGSVTFLADGDHIHRIIWMGKDGQAQFPTKIHFREEAVRFKSRGLRLTGTLVRPPGPGPHPAVVYLPGRGCAPPKMAQAFARTLGEQDLAVLVFKDRECVQGQTLPQDQGLALAAEDALAGLRLLKKIDGLDPSRLGFWGSGEGSLAALRAAASDDSGRRDKRGDTAFVVCALSAKDSGLPAPERSDLAATKAPCLWLFSGENPGLRWRGYLDLVDDLRDREMKPFTVVLMPEEAGGPKQKDVDRLVSGYAAIAGPWIQRR